MVVRLPLPPMRIELKWNYAPTVPLPRDGKLVLAYWGYGYYVLSGSGTGFYESYAGGQVPQDTINMIDWWAYLPEDLGKGASEADLGILNNQPMTARRKVDL